MAETGQTSLYAADEVLQREGRRVEISDQRHNVQAVYPHVQALERVLLQSKKPH